MFCLVPDETYFESLIDGAIGRISLNRLSDNQLGFYRRFLWAIESWASKEHTRLCREEDRRAQLREIGA